MDNSSYIEKVNTFGNVPVAKFGHTATQISSNKIIIFGGASGNVDTYSITNECYCLDIEIGNVTNFNWRKLFNTGTVPCSRAAHSSTKIEDNKMLQFGGATGAGGLAPDTLYLFQLQKDNAVWSEVDIVGETPSKRYGHSLTFTSPYVIQFGGNTGNRNVNDVWCLHIDKVPFYWTKLECKGDTPAPRVYHSADVCQSGAAAGMIVIFGGRITEKGSNDNWSCHGLRRHRNGTWDWVRAPYHGNIVKSRYQHSGLFQGSLMFISGGRTSNVHENLNLDIFDTDTSEWHTIQSLQRFRHVSWLNSGNLYIQGGFKQDSPEIPVADVMKIDILEALKNKPNLVKKLKVFITSTNSNASSRDTTRSNSPIISDKNKPLNQSHQNIQPENNKQLVQKDSSAMDEEKQIYFQLPSQNKHKVGDNQGLSYQALHVEFQVHLLKPKNFFNYAEDQQFMFNSEKVIRLVDMAEEIIKNQPIVQKVQSPIKVFGDIHGQYSDLMRFFDIYGSPCKENS